ncbi:MAG: hypothetical protein JRI25_05635 [Deltaproteobacteria bacterium]|nr:hypothetical protein [Deltaproteobacteria bacterium]
MPGQEHRSESTPAVSPTPPGPDSSQGSGAGNASEVADAGLGAPASLEGIDALRQAVDDGDGAEAWCVVQGLSAGDLAELKADNTLAEQVMALVGAVNAAGVLYQLQYPLDIYLQYADFHCAGSVEALSTVLTDVGIGDASDIVAHLTDLSGLPAFANAELMDPLLEASAAADQGALISSDEGVAFYSSFHSESPLCVLTALAADSDDVLELFITNEPARNLILCDPAILNDHILAVWVTAGPWYRTLGAGMSDDLNGLISGSIAEWVTALVEVLIAGAAEDQAVLPLPADVLSQLILGAIGSQAPDDLVTVCRALGYEPAESMRFFNEQGLLTLERAVALVVGSTAEQQAAVVGIPEVVTTLTALGYIQDLLPLLTISPELPALYQLLPLVQAWLEIDMARFRAIAVLFSVQWIDAFIAAARLQPLFEFAVADAAAWRVLVPDAKFLEILNVLPKPCAEADVAGIWALWTDANRSVDAGYALFHTVFGVRLWSAGQNPEHAMDDWTNNSVTPNITYQRRIRWTIVKASQDAINTYLARVALLPRGLVSASSVGFGDTITVEFKKKNPPPPDGAWGDTKASISKTFTTSVHWRNYRIMLMNVSSGGGGLASGAIRPNLNVQGAAAAPDMNPEGVGGRRQQYDADGNLVARPAATDEALTWFQNHSQHENGHAVGSRAYRGVTRKGDDEAKKYANWKNSTATKMRQAYFSGVPTIVTDVKDSANNDQRIRSEAIGKYLTHVAKTGGEPAASNNVRAAGRVLSKLPGMDRDARVGAIFGSSVGSKNLPDYVYTIIHNGYGLPGGSYRTPDFTPTGNTVHIWAHTQGKFCKYDKKAQTDMLPIIGWYSQTDFREMFAEIYTLHYSTAARTVPPANRGVDWTRWFAKLEASPDAQLQAGVPPAIAGVGAPPDPAAAGAGGGGGGGGGAGGAGPGPGAKSPGGGGVAGSDPLVGIDIEGTPV